MRRIALFDRLSDEEVYQNPWHITIRFGAKNGQRKNVLLLPFSVSYLVKIFDEGGRRLRQFVADTLLDLRAALPHQLIQQSRSKCNIT